MEIPETGDVTTPVDDPCGFDPAWRSKVAAYLFSVGVRSEEDFDSIARNGYMDASRMSEDEVHVPVKKGKKGKQKEKKKSKRQLEKSRRPITPFDAHPEYRPFAMDKWIRGMVSMSNDDLEGAPLADENVPIRLATRWYSEMESEAALRKRLEPLLLTEIGMDIIALDIVGVASAQPAIEAYERLYFNCRDDNFALHPSIQLVNKFAMPWGPLKTYCKKWEELDADGFVIGDGRPLAKDSDIWKAIAAAMGYEALMYHWKWDKRAHGIKDRSLQRMIEISWKAAVSRLFSELFTGDIKHEDAARVLSAYTAQAKYISDEKGGDGGGEIETVKALMAVLYQTAPHMVTLDGDEVMEQRNEEIQSRIQSQLAISKQEIDDKGKQVDAEVMDAQIANAVDSR